MVSERLRPDPSLSSRLAQFPQRGRPRVLIVLENLPLARDVRVGKQVRSLVAAGYAVSVICRRAPGNDAFPGVEVFDYPAPRDAMSQLGFLREYGYSWLMTAAATVRVARSSGFDVLQLCGPPDIFFPIGLTCRAFGRPMVFDQRDPSPELFAARYGRSRGAVYQALRLLEAATYRSADHVITVNETMRAIACGRGRVPADSVTVVFNGPVLAETRDRPARPELRHGREHLCCWMGAMGPQDRLDLALRAIHRLVQVEGRDDCHFAFLGDGEAQAAAMDLSQRLDLGRWVTFTGYLQPAEVFTYLATADVGIEPILDDTVSPVKAMEFMAFGIPFVAFDLVEPRRTGGEAALYAPPGDVTAFARQLGRLLDDPALRAALGQAGRRRVAEDLAWDHQESRYLDVFGRLVGRPLACNDLTLDAGSIPSTGTAAPRVPGRRGRDRAGSPE
jgi:glycosyltransferase involved in cell wall biosynthesis